MNKKILAQVDDSGIAFRRWDPTITRRYGLKEDDAGKTILLVEEFHKKDERQVAVILRTPKDILRCLIEMQPDIRGFLPNSMIISKRTVSKMVQNYDHALQQWQALLFKSRHMIEIAMTNSPMNFQAYESSENRTLRIMSAVVKHSRGIKEYSLWESPGFGSIELRNDHDLDDQVSNPGHIFSVLTSVTGSWAPDVNAYIPQVHVGHSLSELVRTLNDFCEAQTATKRMFIYVLENVARRIKKYE